MEMPNSIVILKNVPKGHEEVWLDVTPAQILDQLENNAQWIDCRRFTGGQFYGFIIATDSIVTVGPYR